MFIITVDNVNQALPIAIEHLKAEGIREDSRNGAVLVAPHPVVTIYRKPTQRVLFSAQRDANPFFHFLEALWMLAGRNDVAFPSHFAANIASFSDDGVTIAGAYGERWRERFGYDQLNMIAKELQTNPKSRRCVLAMWDATGVEGDEPDCLRLSTIATLSNASKRPAINPDLHIAVSGGKDVPCNTHAYFDTIGGKLNMTVCCRSNDIIWGCYGANVVHFSFLLEYVANRAGLEIGEYRQFSNNFHAYIERPDTIRLFENYERGINHYESELNITYSLGAGHPAWQQDLDNFFAIWTPQTTLGEVFQTDFFNKTVAPIVNAHHAYKRKQFGAASMAALDIAAMDWRIACVEWLQRREKKHG